MSWKDNLRRASFRGVRFHVSERELESGRRIHNHEYPKRDQNYPEDMGKKSRRFTVDAYVLGDDYMARRNALLVAGERNGPGQYVDHWGLSQTVVCDSVKVKETSDDGRMAHITFSFIEAGQNFAPMAIAATQALIGSAATALVSAAVASFASRYSR